MGVSSWSDGGRDFARVASRSKFDEITDLNTLNYLEGKGQMLLDRNCPKEAAKFFSMTIKLRTLMIIKKHCI